MGSGRARIGGLAFSKRPPAIHSAGNGGLTLKNLSLWFCLDLWVYSFIPTFLTEHRQIVATCGDGGEQVASRLVMELCQVKAVAGR